ncbi:MAG TPA: hypothetical protein IAC37_03805, partial [Candidatus Ventrimonas merdavium]|nr:hypothetical protein [Candidatus Ventrimonas merdavium]
ATKLDKIKRSQVQKHVKMLRQGLGMEKSDVLIPFSAETKQGRDEIWALIEAEIAGEAEEVPGQIQEAGEPAEDAE